MRPADPAGGDALLHALLRAVPRRYALPGLPPDPAVAAQCDPHTAVAAALEALRLALAAGGTVDAGWEPVFAAGLLHLVRDALDPQAGDASFQAQLLRAQQPAVDEHWRLATQLEGDRRAVRAAVDAVAHPGKLRNRPADARRERLSELHALARGDDWEALHVAAGSLLEDDPLAAFASALVSSPALQRLRRAGVLRATPEVAQYLALQARQGPAAGSAAAAERGDANARRADAAEGAVAQALAALAGWLDDRRPGTRHRVARGLRTPAGFPGRTSQAKEEWDAALLREGEGGAADVVLLVEVKSSPAAAAGDLPRLLRGLHRLALATADADFPAAGGAVRLSAASLRALAPGVDDALPPQVVYATTAAAESHPPALAPASKALLLGDARVLAAAALLQAGQPADPAPLAALWSALAVEPRWAPVLAQYHRAWITRQAMVHPADLGLGVASS